MSSGPVAHAPWDAPETPLRPLPQRVVRPGGEPAAERLFETLPGGGYAYRLPGEGVVVELRYLRREFGHVVAEVDVRCDWATARGVAGSLSCADLNLSNQAQRRSLATYCGERSRTKGDAFDWFGVVDAACVQALKAMRTGEPAIVLDDAPDVPEQDFDVHGIKIPADATSMLFAPGESAKSLILLYILGTLAGQGVPVLYLDWEWSATRHKARKVKLFGDSRIPGLHYLRCHAPLVHEADRIRRFCDAHTIGFLGLDSVGLACDGKLSDDDVAIRFNRTLATIERPAMCAAHVSKSTMGPDGAKAGAPTALAFGSVFFTNLARMCWFVRRQPESAKDRTVVGLFPTKQNDGARAKPVGLELTFTDTRITVEPTDLANIDGLSEHLSIRDRIAHTLKRRGGLTIAEIAVEVDAKPDSVTKALKRGGFIRALDNPDGVHRWALAERRPA